MSPGVDKARAALWLIDAPEGTRVLLVGQHPYAGERGMVVRWERPYWAFAPLPVVRLDGGDEEVFVKDAEQWREEAS